jgi:hypothetical protein
MEEKECSGRDEFRRKNQIWEIRESQRLVFGCIFCKAFTRVWRSANKYEHYKNIM